MCRTTSSAEMLFDVVATLRGMAPVTLGGALLSTLGNVVLGGVVGPEPAIICVIWQIAHMCCSLAPVDVGMVCVCVCVDLSSGQRRPFPILRLTKACWTYPPPLGT
jgi:hypothetical protein